ncbi:hypothetical protein L596_022759 [Steinernema carpocapsae]|uniref:Uncharacterized protein n=1 Tax=Steinernema carpocapsae TaxID=34508 RepID=A0A4U5MMR8_STECR|nr:hypothetical protein L596_022759 [Steinernema carpocapsae]
MTIYEKLLSQLREAVQSLKDEARKAGTSTSLETAIAFFDFARLTKTAERYIFMVNAIQADESRKSKPQDFIRLLDSIVATYEEAAGVQGSDSVEGFADVMDFKAEYYKSLKAYYNAEMYTTNSKFAESDLLYGRALERAEKAENMLKNVAGNPLISETQKDIAETKAKISSSKIEAEENRDKEAAEPAQKPIFFDLALNYVKMPKKEKQEEVEEMEDNKEQPAVLPAPKPAAPSKPAPKKKTAPKSAATEPQAQGISDKFKGWFWGS